MMRRGVACDAARTSRREEEDLRSRSKAVQADIRSQDCVLRVKSVADSRIDNLSFPPCERNALPWWIGSTPIRFKPPSPPLES